MSDLTMAALTFYVVANMIVWVYIVASLLAKHYPLLDEAKYEAVKVKHILMVVLFLPAVATSFAMVLAFKLYRITLVKSYLFFRYNKVVNKAVFRSLKRKDVKNE